MNPRGSNTRLLKSVEMM